MSRRRRGQPRLDLACPGVRLGVEYDGGELLDPARVLRDLDRQAWLARAGWTIPRLRAYDVLRRPWRVASTVRSELIRAARSLSLVQHGHDPR